MSQNPPQDAKLEPDNDKLLSVPIQGYAFTHPQKPSQTMWTGLLKLAIGILVGFTLLIGIGSGVGYYFINKLATSPPKPVFNEEKDALAKKAVKTNSELLPPGAYRGRVIPQKGLSLRAKADRGAEKVGVVGYNQEVIALKSSEDKEWLQIRVKKTKKEGWVRASNIEKLDVPTKSGKTAQ